MARNVRKKGSIEVQVNWVFILIAGAIILIVAFSFVTKLRAASKVKVADSLVKDIEAIATGAQIAKGGSQTVPVPKVNIEFACTEECTCGFRVGPAEKMFKDKVIFAPDNLEDVAIIFLALDWKMPFRVTNFLYASNRFVKYFIVSEPGKGTEIIDIFKKKLPDTLVVEYIDVEKVHLAQPQNYQEFKFVFVHTPFESDLDKFAKKDYGVIHIAKNKEITFFDKKSKKRAGFKQPPVTLAYAGDAALLGAVFSDDATMYRCNMETALRRLGYIAEVYSARANALQQKALEGVILGVDCSYTTSAISLSNLGSAASQAASQFDAASMGSLAGYVDEINIKNQELLRASCPLLY